MSELLPISGYVLAGGRSSRMGTDKALLDLAGRPLIAHAVAKLRRVSADVGILGSDPALAAHGPVVADLHPNLGPLGGVEAALAHSCRDWSLIYAVDMPFLPAAVLYEWALAVTNPAAGYRVAVFSVDGRPQPAVCLLHREIAPSVGAAIALGELRLWAVLEAAAEVLALQQHQLLADVLSLIPLPGIGRDAQAFWFRNLNTPEDFALAETDVAALEL